MNEYTLEYWFRYSGDHKDFDTVTIKSETEEKAREEVQAPQSSIFIT
jgi:hypothetical protein